MYTKWCCGYCMWAKRLLSEKGVELELISVTFKPHKFQEMRQRSGGLMTAPQIFIGDHHVGGYRELVDLERSGKLDALLVTAGEMRPTTAGAV